jgi:predicted dehydrogenase
MRVLMVGLGGVGQRHLRNLRSLLGLEAEIAAYRVRSDSRVLTDQLQIEGGSSLEEKYSVCVHTDLDEALGLRPDAVFVCNPSSLHIPIALRAAQAGCNLFIEKPLSHNWERVDELVNLVESQHIKAVVGYQMRFHPCLQRLSSLLQERRVGQILAVRAEVAEYLPAWHAYEDYRKMYASKRELGGGVILSQIHELDYIYWLWGLPRRMFALGGHLSSLEIDVEDTVSMLMECSVNRHSVPISLHQDYVQRPGSRTCEVIGDAGKILVDLRALTVDVFDEAGAHVEAVAYERFQRNQMFMDELKHFLECLRGRGAPSVTLRDGAQSLRMALAAKQSLETGRVVDMEEWSA